MVNKSLAAIPPSSSNGAVFLCDERSHTSALVPICLHSDITVRELAEEFCVSSVLECDATGCVQPRAVALDSPLDVLHAGKYYIARRDVPRVGNSPRVIFRGKITVEEFETDHALENEENIHISSAGEERSKITATEPRCTETRKRRHRDDESDDESEVDKSLYDAIDANKYTFVPFVGDIHANGRTGLIQLEDVKRLCENIEGDEIVFNTRHAQAKAILDRANDVLLKLAADI